MATENNSGINCKQKRVLITGLDGFIGHHVADYLLSNTDWFIVGISKIDQSSTLHRLKEIEATNPNFKGRVEFIYHDLRSPINTYLITRLKSVNYILHMAANTHVDKSIQYPMEFVQDNVVGTCTILEYARQLTSLELFVYFSTDEVFGPAPPGTAFKEWDRYKSGNPYAATKAGGEELALSYFNTYKLPVIITHTMNVIGERQHPEKFVPKVINAVLNEQCIYVHSNPVRSLAGSRSYIYAKNVAAALLFLINHHVAHGNLAGDKFNIVGQKEVDNLTIAKTIAKIIGKPLLYEMVDFHSSRPGHDLRYALDGTKLLDMNFKYPLTFDESLEKTVLWFLDNKDWLLSQYSRDALSKEHSDYLKNQQL